MGGRAGPRRGLGDDEIGEELMARIGWIDDGEATGDLAAIYDRARAEFPGGMVPDILKTMSLRPDFLAGISQAARLHFSDGALTRAQHEMIASYVSALNRCHY
jgi:hypothetical protein